ncbi:phage terminase family protein [Amycolatopsis anabasis]|uniref:phage terminase family protein n=1 Tax=Amycolatopsis anabasis TaxID=1840409 RepID=UPI001C550554|nr:phage terminase family protein [Amycolatopsis anabasis]
MTGPTWRRLKSGGFWLPEHSLGWGVINWMAAWLRHPEDLDKPFLPTLEQARFLVWWYACDERGRFVYRSGILRRLKGWGKDPLVAAMSLAELCGPVAFSHWDADGKPVGKQRSAAWIQVAAVSQDQTRNTFALFAPLASPKLVEQYGLDLNKTIIYSRDGGMIEAVTSSPLALEGKRPTLVIMNEVQWWVESNSGHDMYSVIEGNVTKRAGNGARYLAICNAHRPGEESIGERLWDNYLAVQGGQAIDTGILYDALEAPADTPVSEIPNPDVDPTGFEAGIEQLRRGLEVARGDATWLDLGSIIASILDINNLVSESRRKYLNQVNASEDAWVAPHEWDRAHSAVELQPGDRITMAFDGSKGGDWSALVACRVDDAAIIPLKVWNPELYGGEVPREDVDAMVHWAFSRFEVVAFRSDVKEFEAYVDQWGQKYKKKLKIDAIPGKPIAFDMRGSDNTAVRKKFALDCERFLDALLEGELTHNGDKVLRAHVLNAHRHPTNFDAITIRKASKDSARKIDAAVCAVMAYGARQEFLMSKKNRSRKAVVMR